MLRSDFIKGIIGFLGLSALPASMVKQYHRYYLLQSFVRGFRFYEGLKLLDEMHEGDLLEMLREPANEYDPKAIALYFNQHKIGFIPKEDNDILSRLMDADVVKLQAEITHLNKEAKAWENVHIGVYVLKETNEPITENAKYLTVLETPHYHTIKVDSQKTADVYFTDDEEWEILDAEAFYETMVENSRDNSVYNFLHIDSESGQNLQQVINEGRMIVNQRHLPEDLKIDKLVKALDEGVIGLDAYFDKSGYVVANVNRVAGLSARINKVANVLDKAGRTFYEIQFS